MPFTFSADEKVAYRETIWLPFQEATIRRIYDINGDPIHKVYNMGKKQDRILARHQLQFLIYRNIDKITSDDEYEENVTINIGGDTFVRSKKENVTVKQYVKDQPILCRLDWSDKVFYRATVVDVDVVNNETSYKIRYEGRWDTKKNKTQWVPFYEVDILMKERTKKAEEESKEEYKKQLAKAKKAGSNKCDADEMRPTTRSRSRGRKPTKRTSSAPSRATRAKHQRRDLSRGGRGGTRRIVAAYPQSEDDSEPDMDPNEGLDDDYTDVLENYVNDDQVDPMMPMLKAPDQANVEMDRLRREIEEMKIALKEKETELLNERTRREDAEKKEADYAREIGGERLQSQAKIHDLEQQLQDAQSDANNKQRRAEELENKLNYFTDFAIKQTKKMEDHLGQVIADLKKSVEEKDEEIDALLKEKQDASAEAAEEIEKAKKHADDRLAQLEKSLEEKRTEIERLQKEMNKKVESEKFKEEQKKEDTEKYENPSCVRVRLHALNGSLQSVQSQIHGLQEREECMQKQVKEIMKKLESHEEEITLRLDGNEEKFGMKFVGYLSGFPLISGVVAGSAAEREGIISGDQLIFINEVFVHGYSEAKLDDLFKSAVQKREMTITRSYNPDRLPPGCEQIL